MNIFEERLSRFKKELVSILYLSAIQVWLNFNFPAFVRLGTPWSTIIGLAVSIASICVYIFVFSYADRYASYFDLEYLNAAPESYRNILKSIQKMGLITVMLIIMFFLWYKDYYGMSSTWYAILYAYWIMTFLLIARAINRHKNSSKSSIQ